MSFGQIVYNIPFILTFFAGLFLGFCIALSQITKKIMKKIENGSNYDYELIDEDKRKKIEECILKSQNFYKLKEEQKRQDRLRIFKKKHLEIEEYNMKNLFNDVQKVFYPNSENPLLELKVDEVFELVNRITKRFEESIEATNIPNIKYVKISVIYKLLNIYNKVELIRKMKLVKFIIGIMNFSLKITSLLSPSAIIKRQTNSKITSSLSLVITYNMCNIVAKETACIFSKNNKKENLIFVDNLEN